MHLILVYDIADDRIRAKIADACLDYGLDRIQFSAFTGQLSRNHQEELMLHIAKVLGKKPGNVMLIPFCDRDWAQRLEAGHA